MNSLFPSASLKRSPSIHTRKLSSEPGCPPSPSSTANRDRPLHIIPELSENHSEFDSEPPSPSNPSIPKFGLPPRPSPRVTLSAFPFSIDDALLMLNDEPHSPALSASSSTGGSNFSDELPTTPGASDNEDSCELRLPSPRLRPHHIEIRPLRITKSRADDQNIPDITENDINSHITVAEIQKEVEDEHDFYTCQFEDFISLYSTCVQVSVPPARPESIIFSLKDASELPVAQPKPRGRSRFSKALPRLPFPMPPSSTLPTFPPVPNSVQTASKRVIPPMPTYPPPLPPVERRPPPRTPVPSDIGELDLFEGDSPSLVEQVCFDDQESIYSPPSSALAHSSVFPLPPALPETPANEIYLPRASTDSDAPRSSLDSSSSSSGHSSPSSESVSISPFSFPPTPIEILIETPIETSHQLRSRWSLSTLNSPDFEPPRTATFLSPLRNVFGSKSRRSRSPPLIPAPPTQAPTHARVHSKMSLTRLVFPATPSPPSTPSHHVHSLTPRSSTSSLASSEYESDSGNNSSGLRRKPIPVEMFLRA